MSDQYIRKGSLIVSTGSDGLDLSELRFSFKTEQSDTQTPNNAYIRIYNLSKDTSKRIQSEYSRVTLQAGYENGRFGIIFDGTIKQIRRGRESAVDTYLDLLAADGDLAYIGATMNKTLAAGSTAKQRLDATMEAAAPHGVTLGTANGLTGGVLPRGKVLYGMWRDEMRQIAQQNQQSWSINNGKVEMHELTGYLPGTAVKLTAETGMIGMPEQTENGIRVRSLLNPSLVPGGLVQIDNNSIQQTTNLTAEPTPYNQYVGLQLLATVTDDGFYQIYVAEHVGDIRGQEWYTDMVCLAVDVTQPAADSVKAYG